ncbi:FixH family protein [Bermanella marisrubri]|uniref:Nitrogen fixation protein FixH n=2 Tax=Bermanella marisrubri TaxID=207949 RepID=Q1N681_9GAMM|nr:FixH family protein [Bermanella marisrubri]EAT13711.1 hypothetical protein RED65_09974 [Oceanobacter sp. RED65] [Bermanella marisrubri]
MQEQKRPWYREPYVWLLIGIPSSSVIMGIFFINLAVSTKDTLVRDNYYKDGLAYNQELEWDNKAEANDIKLSLTVSKDSEVRMTIENSRLALPNILQVAFSHPTLKGKDRNAVLQQVDGQTYVGLTEQPIEFGRYYINVESPQQAWRVRHVNHVNAGQTLKF